MKEKQRLTSEREGHFQKYRKERREELLKNDEQKYLQNLNEMIKKGEEEESKAVLIKLREQLETKNALSKQIDSKYQNYKTKKDEELEYAERIKKKVLITKF